MIKKVFLIGNPNVGKSVVFSRLTGVRVISSNYPGTTVEITKGYLDIAGERLEVVDLPGAYSLEPSSKAEEIAVSLLKEYPKDESVVINIIDSTNLERNLYLTLQLIEEGFSVIACLNMCDDTKHRGIDINITKLEELLGVPVVSTCAVTGVGIKLLVQRIEEVKPSVRNKPTHQERWLQIGKIIESTQRLTHRHHTFRELLEDISVRPFSGMLLASGVVFVSFKVVRFIGETLISKIFDPLFFNVYQPLLDKISPALSGNPFLYHLLIGDLINGKMDFKQSLGLLTDPQFSRRLKDLLKHKELSVDNTELLKLGRHFRLSTRAKLVVGRNELENNKLIELAWGEDYLFMPVAEIAGPVSLGRGVFDDETLDISRGITARYCDLEGRREVDLVCRYQDKEETLKSLPLAENSLKVLRV